jgi:hypothetical protein
VEDDSSNASYREGDGIRAASMHYIPMYPRGNEKKMDWLDDELSRHLDWYNEKPSPFISVSTDREWAFGEANRREKYGKTDVVVYEIRAEGNRGTYWESVEDLLDMVDSDTPGCADHPSTENEYLFLHHIPEKFIVRRTRI